MATLSAERMKRFLFLVKSREKKHSVGDAHYVVEPVEYLRTTNMSLGHFLCNAFL